jgi:hypothetical protein
MPNVSTCFYCNKTYSNDTEHVFSYGLGGQNLFMDCVCQKCNSYFSGLERELYQKSIIGLMRSTEGVDGYNPSQSTPAPFKAPLLLTQDKEHGIIFEVGQFYQMQTFIRPQLIFFRGVYYIEANTAANSDRFIAAWQKWLNGDALLSGYDSGQVLTRQYILNEEKYNGVTITTLKKLKNAIKFSSLPQNHHLFEALTPRLYFDDDKNLRIRAKTFDEAADFLRELLDHTLTSPVFNSFKGSGLQEALIDVGFSFDGLKFDQALVKIGLNTLLYHFPLVKTDPALIPLVNFVMKGSPGINAAWDKKHMIFDSQEGKHNISFGQAKDHTHIRISLFNGQFAFGFWIENLKLFQSSNYARQLIDYKNRINTFQDNKAFLMSFQPNRNSIPEA